MSLYLENTYRIIFLGLLYLPYSFGDSFTYNSYNNHGVVGLINMPTARFYDEASHGVTLYNGTPDQKITLTSNPYDWLEASFFYANLENRRYCDVSFDPVCNQGYKDKGFNFKVRIKKEGNFPAIALGVNDIAGTGLYSSEYIVASYGLNNYDFHFGLGWGNLNGSPNNFKNPLSYIYDGFSFRPTKGAANGGQFQASRYFSDKEVSPFYGLTYAINKKVIIKIENDTTLTPGFIGYENPQSEFSFGIDYKISKNFTLGLSQERGSEFTLKFIYKSNPSESQKVYKYKSAEVRSEENKFIKLRMNLEKNGIGVNKIFENSKSIGIELTQFTHPNLDIIEEIISYAALESGITKEVKKDLRISNLKAVSEYDNEFGRNSKLIYERQRKTNFNTDTKLTFKPFLASREEFFKGAIILQNNSEFIIRDNFFFSTDLKYSLADNFDDLIYPPVNTFPAQVRSDIKKYLNNYDQGIIIGRAQFDYHISPKKNNHIMVTAGILEDMYSGYGMEYLYFKEDSNFAVGFEVFDVVKRDYDLRFGTLDYRNTVGSLNFYYRNHKVIPFDAKVSYGEYLAGDIGSTYQVSRSFRNGVQFGVFATFTDVNRNQFGEGAFDKGIFFNIPVFGNLINYSWKPLTKDPGAKLNRKHTLHDLLIKFRAYNE